MKPHLNPAWDPKKILYNFHAFRSISVSSNFFMQAFIEIQFVNNIFLNSFQEHVVTIITPAITKPKSSKRQIAANTSCGDISHFEINICARHME